MADLKPKRGWVCEEDIRDFEDYSYATVHVDPDGPSHAAIPVLLVPEPDRDPTEAEVDALARACIRAAFGTKEMYEAPSDSELALARAAWRLGARVQA